ncbi:NAD(P)/FAD-dependent oxidoreductase [Sneathiella chinensis]|uniref:FAD/NAD(P)-binding domain-containing protein n=1 Tax=Sneathiella chinensis TaxID=349750 RepID=A0ABQ5U2A6_9PROT|nr:FAD/NAD(P)-binding oxidoreductase [Sneathiella chinensis]GLQ05394.1 hypothetical protein GCM10007924_06150 [Sneathiella chinensis]
MMRRDTDIPETCDVAVVGGGTSGLALAAELKRLGIGSVVVLEREQDAGGIPRHCGHYPFGVREYGRLLKGPEYARRNVEAAVKAGVAIHTQTTVTALHPDGELSLSTPAGVCTLKARRVVLCTGVRESSRAQRFVGGERPQGVMSTGALQSLVYLGGMRPFRNPVILGSELVSFSAIATCTHLGIRPVAMIEEESRIVARPVFRPYLMMHQVRLFTGARKTRIIGRDRVEAVEFENASGALTHIETDGVIISGRFRPESALLRASHLELDRGSGGPAIDQFGQCSDPAYYSTGNLLRPAETSSWCWHEGVETARNIAEDLSGSAWTVRGSVSLTISDPAIRFVVPQRLTLTDRPGGMTQMQVGLSAPVQGRMSAKSGDREIWSARLHSRPVRRILFPLDPLRTASLEKTIELSVSRRG